MPDFVKEWVRDIGDFSIVTSHAVHTASGMMAVMGEHDGIAELRAILQEVPELHVWLPVAEEAERDAELVERILEVVARAPGMRQADLKRTVGVEDGRRVATLASWMEKAGRLRRVKDGATNRLYPAGHRVEAEGTVGSKAESDRSREASGPVPSQSFALVGDKPLRKRSRPLHGARAIDLGSVPYLRLPKAPLRWNVRQEERPRRGV